MALKLDILKDVKNKNSFRSYSYADLHLDIDLDAKTLIPQQEQKKTSKTLKLTMMKKLFTTLLVIFLIQKKVRKF